MRPNAVNISGFAGSTSCNTFDIEIYYREGGLDNQRISGTITMSAELEDHPFAIAKADGEGSYLTVAPSTNITFNGSESGDPLGQSLTYEWDLKDGTTETGQTFNHSYSSTGTYMVELNVTNQEGISSQDYIEIDVRKVQAVAKAHNETDIFRYNYLEAYEGEVITFNGSETTDTDGLNIVDYE